MTRVRRPSAQATAVVLALADRLAVWLRPVQRARHSARLAVPDPGAARRPGAAGDRLGLLFAGDGGPVGVTLADAVAILCFIALVGLPCAVFGAYHTAAPGPTGRRASAAVNGHV